MQHLQGSENVAAVAVATMVTEGSADENADAGNGAMVAVAVAVAGNYTLG